jgi:integrase/recombinase XerD
MELAMADIHLDYVNDFTDSRNKKRYVFRRKGFKKKTVKGRPGSQEFMDAYHALLAETGGAMPVDNIGAGRVRAGTIDALILRYVKADSFKRGLAAETQKMRLPILDHFRNHLTPSGRRYGDNKLAGMGKQSIEAVLEGKTSSTQRNWLITLRGLIAFGMAHKECSADASAGLKPTKAIKSKGRLTWKPPQVRLYRERHPLGTMARLSLELMLNVAARRADACILGRQHMSFNAEHQVNVLTWRPSKTLRSTGKSLSIPVIPSLQAALDAMPRGIGDNVTTTAFLKNDLGQPFASAAAFGMAFARWCRQAGLKSVSCDDGRTRNYRAHGLRKAAVCTLFRNGGDTDELLALSGHSSVAQLQPYIQEYEQDEAAISGMMKVAASQTKNRV